MAKHDPDDIVTTYFVLKKEGDKTIIQGWSEDKKMVEAYMEFHNCKKFRVKKVTMVAKKMAETYEENIHDEIDLFNITTRDQKHRCEVKSITIPATATEIQLLNDETNTLATSLIDYSFINGAVPYLKKKYRQALMDVGLLDFIKKILHNQRSKFVDIMQFDQLILLYRLFNDNFD